MTNCSNSDFHNYFYFLVPISQVLDSFISVSSRYPLLHSLIKFLDSEALSISNGGPEYIHSKSFLDIYWPIDEYLFIDLVVNSKLDIFYSELKSFLIELLSNSQNDYFDYLSPDAATSIISESIDLNHWLLNTTLKKPQTFESHWNILDCFESHINGGFVDLSRSNANFQISDHSPFHPDLDDWLREIVWYGNKRGSYLHLFDRV